MNYKTINLPLTTQLAKQLHAGQACYLNGPLFTLRDAGHIKLLQEIKDIEIENKNREQNIVLPYGLDGQIIFYAGPTPAKNGLPFGAIGPTTASRMDFAAVKLYEKGVIATIGKGQRSEAITQACIDYSTLYFVATGGVAALLAQCVKSSETIAYKDLGTEALRKIEVENFPVFVGIDTYGHTIYDIEQ